MIDPIVRFGQWLAEAKGHPDITEPTAMSLATATKEGVPSVRMVLLKGVDTRGFVFYTNMESRKSREIKANPHAALCFFWKALGKQVRVEGVVEKVSDSDADAYYASRPLEARLGAIASQQSQPLASRDELLDKVRELKGRYDESHPPMRPASWSGWRVVPKALEFWQEGEFRLHDREHYICTEEGWSRQKLYP